MSKGSVSQACKVLRSFGAITSVYVPGSRRDYFEAERELRSMTTGFLSEQVQPQLKEARNQINQIEALLTQYPADQHNGLGKRIHQLRKWERRASRVLPFFLKLISRPPR